MLIVLLFAVPCLAQDPGDRVRVTASQGTKVTLTGTLVEKSETGLVLKRRQYSGDRMVPYVQISKLERSIANGRHWRKGFLFGAAAGVPIGYLIGQWSANFSVLGDSPADRGETGEHVAGGIFFASSTLGLTGMVIGALIPREKWEVIPVSPVSSVKGLGVRIQL